MMRNRRHGDNFANAAIGSATLTGNPEVMRCTGGLKLDVSGERLIVEPVQHSLVVGGRDHLLFGDVDSAANRDKQEGVERVSSETSCKLEYGWQLMRVVARDGGIDLHGYAYVLKIA